MLSHYLLYQIKHLHFILNFKDPIHVGGNSECRMLRADPRFRALLTGMLLGLSKFIQLLVTQARRPTPVRFPVLTSAVPAPAPVLTALPLPGVLLVLSHRLDCPTECQLPSEVCLGLFSHTVIVFFYFYSLVIIFAYFLVKCNVSSKTHTFFKC